MLRSNKDRTRQGKGLPGLHVLIWVKHEAPHSWMSLLSMQVPEISVLQSVVCCINVLVFILDCEIGSVWVIVVYWGGGTCGSTCLKISYHNILISASPRTPYTPDTVTCITIPRPGQAGDLINHLYLAGIVSKSIFARTQDRYAAQSPLW